MTDAFKRLNGRIDWERGTVRVSRKHVWWAKPILTTIDEAARYRSELLTALVGALCIYEWTRNNMFGVATMALVLGIRMQRSIA